MLFKPKALTRAEDRISDLSRSLQEQQIESRNLERQITQLTDKLEESAASNQFDWRLQRDKGWQLVSGRGMQHLTKQDVDKYADISEYYYIFNPLIKRVIDVRTLFTFSKGFDISVEEGGEDIKDQALTPVLNDPYNRAAFTSQQAQEQNDKTLQKGANLFIAIYRDTKPNVSIRIIPAEEITGIIYAEGDCYRPLYYKREYGGKTKYYPDFRNENTRDAPADTDTSVVVYHVAANKIDSIGFGITDIAAAYRWAEAQGQFLEDWGAVVRAIRKYSTMVQTPATNQGTINAIGAQFAGDTNNMHTPLQSNPSGSMLTMGGGNEYKVVDAGSNKVVGPKDSRLFTLQVCAATGVPETILTGDPSTGNLATAKELTGPFMTLIEARQSMWADVWKNLCEYIIRLSGHDVRVKVSFPAITEDNVNDRVQAIISAATLDSKMWAGTMNMRDVVRAVYSALGIEITDDELDDLAGGVEMDTAATEALKRINENLQLLADDGK